MINPISNNYVMFHRHKYMCKIQNNAFFVINCEIENSAVSSKYPWSQVYRCNNKFKLPFKPLSRICHSEDELAGIYKAKVNHGA